MTSPIVFRMRRIFELQDPRHARLLPMEGLRGFAVTLVFLQHYTLQAQHLGLPSGFTASFAAAFRNYGNLGVELFFVLSGYLIYGTLVRRAPGFGGFMARRLQRLYPAYLVVFALALGQELLKAGGSKIPEGGWDAAGFLVANLLLLPGLFPIAGLIDVAWSLSYEIFFYLVTAGLVLGARMTAMPRRRRIAILLVLSAGFLAVASLEPRHFPVRMMPFFAGMLLAEGVGARIPGWAGLVLPLVGFVISITAPLPPVSAEFAQTVAFFALCAVCFADRGLVSRAMTWTPLRWLGNMSYSYYLLHGSVVSVGFAALVSIHPGTMPAWLFWTYLPILFAGTLAAAAVLFIAVEKPLSLTMKVSIHPHKGTAGIGG